MSFKVKVYCTRNRNLSKEIEIKSKEELDQKMLEIEHDWNKGARYEDDLVSLDYVLLKRDNLPDGPRKIICKRKGGNF